MQLISNRLEVNPKIGKNLLDQANAGEANTFCIPVQHAVTLCL